MPKTIWKYPLSAADDFIIAMPLGSRVLSVMVQDEVPYIWVLFSAPEDELTPGAAPLMAKYHFKLVGTGHVRNDLDDAVYIGSFMLADGKLVFHLFQGMVPDE
jgi:hypothetical protein